MECLDERFGSVAYKQDAPLAIRIHLPFSFFRMPEHYVFSNCQPAKIIDVRIEAIGLACRLLRSVSYFLRNSSPQGQKESELTSPKGQA